ncbi:MAG: SDR family NAD(P)-dependent oxidoreductase [Geminicoccaceae bacterium]
MKLGLEGRLAIITGSAQGIGAAIAEGFAGEGAALLLVDRNSQVATVADQLDAEAIICDLADPDAAEAVGKKAAELGGARILINNAGISRPAPIGDMTNGDWDAVMNVNASTAFRLIRTLWPQLSQDRGAVVNITSFAAKRATLFGNNASYVASKHALAGLTRAAALDGATAGVRVNGIAPGVVDTDLVKLHDEATRQKIMAAIPEGRFADPAEIADLALFLASDRARHICGEIININGGLYMD